MSEIVELSDLLPWMRTLPGYKKQGQWHIAKCPCHDDKLASLGMSPTGVLRCYAGCSFKDLMDMRREFSPQERMLKRQESDWKVVDRYEYKTVDGLRTGTKSRIESTKTKDNGKRVKRFTWVMEDGKSPSEHGITIEDFGFWKDPNDDGERRVFITEGEKACKAVRARGEIATCPPGSASNVPPREALEEFRGRDIIIWRDLDGPGLRWAENLKRALRYIAKSVRIVAAPGEEGDDAHDYFTGGGQLEDLLAVTRAITEKLTDDHYRVTTPTDYGPVVFDADEISHHVSHGKSELNTVMRVTLALPGTEEESYVERINMYSATSKGAFITALSNQFDGEKKAWTRIVNSAFEQIDSEVRNNTRASEFTYNPDRPSREFLVDTLFPYGHHSILFAPPAVGKSYTVQEISLCIALGIPFVGFNVKQGPVLILDYESQRIDWEERWERLLSAHGFSPEFMAELPIRYMSAGGVPLSEQWRNIKREMQLMGATCLIIDSAMPAAGGDMFSTSVAAAYFSALDRIGCTSITIGQVPAADSSRLYGNQEWQYAPHGRIWQLEKQQQQGSAGDHMEVSFHCKKSSNGRPPESFAIEVEFSGDNGPVYFNRVGLRDIPAFVGDKAGVIESWLRIAGPSLPAFEIAQETALDVDEVAKILKSDHRFIELRSTAPGVPTRWGLASGM